MKDACRLVLACGLVFSSMLVGCVGAEPDVDDEEDVAEASSAFKPTAAECEANDAEYVAGCYEIEDLTDHQICLWFAAKIFENCMTEAGAIVSEDDQLVTGGQGSGFHPGFRGGYDPFDNLVPDP